MYSPVQNDATFILYGMVGWVSQILLAECEEAVVGKLQSKIGNGTFQAKLILKFTFTALVSG